MPQGGIHQLINAGEWVTIHWIDLVKIGVVNMHPPTFINFLNQDDIREP